MQAHARTLTHAHAPTRHEGESDAHVTDAAHGTTNDNNKNDKITANTTTTTTPTTTTQHALAVDHVLRLQPGGGADGTGLLAVVLHVERNAAVALHLVEHLVHVVQPHHRLVDLDALRPPQLGVLGSRHDVALVVHDAESRVSVAGRRDHGNI